MIGSGRRPVTLFRIIGVDGDGWWGLIGRARDVVGGRADDRDFSDDPLPEALVGVLASLEPAEIIDFSVRHVAVTDSAYRSLLWDAAYLIEGGCGDDGFMDFRDGLMLLGREVFTRAVADPDSLADLPVVVRMSRGEGGWIGYESLDYLIGEAYERVQGERDSLDAAVEEAVRGMTRPTKPIGEDRGGGEEGIRRRLPQLAAVFPA